MILYLFIKDRVESYFAHLCISYNRKQMIIHAFFPIGIRFQ